MRSGISLFFFFCFIDPGDAPAKIQKAKDWNQFQRSWSLKSLHWISALRNERHNSRSGRSKLLFLSSSLKSKIKLERWFSGTTFFLDADFNRRPKLRKKKNSLSCYFFIPWSFKLTWNRLKPGKSLRKMYFLGTSKKCRKTIFLAFELV